MSEAARKAALKLTVSSPQDDTFASERNFIARAIDAAADEKYEPLVKAAQLKRSVIMYDVPNFSGEWVAIPRSDFDLLREALRQIEREKK